MRFIRRRLLRLLPVLFAVTALSFLLLNLLPGDPTIALLGNNATPEAVAQLREEMGLDRPLPARYVSWLGNTATGDLGRSYLNNQPVFESIRERLPVTLKLLVMSQIIALSIAVPFAILAARRPGGLLDRVSTSLAFGFLAVPNFILAVVLVYVFAVRLDAFPATGLPDLDDGAFEHFRALVLPAFSLAMAELAAYLRLLRSDMVATLQEDFIAMARAKGMPSSRILLRHAFRPSSFSLVTVIGLNVGRLIGGTIIIEAIFALPGIGLLALQSIYSRDYLVVQGVVVVVAVGYVLINLAVDLLYAALDPRIRHARALA